MTFGEPFLTSGPSLLTGFFNPSLSSLQGYVMCIKDYDFMVLDNAFLVHRPGIKKTSKSPPVAFKAQSKVINDHIIPEIERLYGKRKGCFLA